VNTVWQKYIIWIDFPFYGHLECFHWSRSWIYSVFPGFLSAPESITINHRPEESSGIIDPHTRHVLVNQDDNSYLVFYYLDEFHQTILWIQASSGYVSVTRKDLLPLQSHFIFKVVFDLRAFNTRISTIKVETGLWRFCSWIILNSMAKLRMCQQRPYRSFAVTFCSEHFPRSTFGTHSIFCLMPGIASPSYY